MFHQHFNTPEGGGAIRSYYLATALVQHGHHVTVITSHSGRERCEKTIEGVHIIYLPVPYDNRFTFYARAWSFLRFVFDAILAATPYRTYDHAYGISAPLTVGLCTLWMKFRYGMPYLFEVGDLWPDAPIQLGFIRNRLFQWMLFRLEKMIYRNSRTVVALSTPIAKAIGEKSPGIPVVVVPNMADDEFYFPDEGLKDKQKSEREKFVVSYIGALGFANGLHQLLDCALECQARNLPVTFIICGDGAMADDLKNTVKQREIGNVTFAGFINRDGVREIMSMTDAVFISYLPVPILETGCPNKYFDGLAAGKVIIVNFGGWIRDEIESHQCGFYTDPADPADFAKKIGSFLTDHSKLKNFQQRSRSLAEGNYSRKKLSASFASLFSKS